MAITNLLNVSLTSSMADPSQVATAFSAATSLPLAADWSSSTFLNVPGNRWVRLGGGGGKEAGGMRGGGEQGAWYEGGGTN